MTERVRILIEQAKQLTPEERADVLDALLALQEGFPGPDEKAWRALVRERLSRLEQGLDIEEDFDEAIAEIRSGR